ncbi:MAG: DUF2080 family transposase-associated protein [Candidatus Woesearchaeota archaeon]
MKVEIDNVEEVIEKKVDSYSTSTRIIIPKKYAGRRVKVLILEEDFARMDKSTAKSSKMTLNKHKSIEVVSEVNSNSSEEEVKKR